MNRLDGQKTGEGLGSDQIPEGTEMPESPLEETQRLTPIDKNDMEGTTTVTVTAIGLGDKAMDGRPITQGDIINAARMSRSRAELGQAAPKIGTDDSGRPLTPPEMPKG